MRAFVLLVCGVLLVCSAGAQTAPALDADALDGSKIHLPATNQPTVLILGFSRRAGSGVSTWSKALTHAAWNGKLASVYEVGFLGPVPRPIRGLVLRALRKDVPLTAQSHFATFYGEPQPWKTLAAVTSDDQPYVVLLDSLGAVRWRGHGSYNDALDNDLSRQIVRLQSK